MKRSKFCLCPAGDLMWLCGFMKHYYVNVLIVDRFGVIAMKKKQNPLQVLLRK